MAVANNMLVLIDSLDCPSLCEQLKVYFSSSLSDECRLCMCVCVCVSFMQVALGSSQQHEQ